MVRTACRLMSGAVLLCSVWGCGNASFDTGSVSGVVEAPNGMIARRDGPGLLDRFAAYVVGTAWAITGLKPVAPGIEVRLERIDAQGQVTQLLTTTSTDRNGSYSFVLASNEQPESSLTVAVGEGATLMRAFVSQEDVPINSAGEATVRLVLSASCNLSRFSPGALIDIQNKVNQATADVAAGANVSETNGKAEQRATDDEQVRAAIDAVCG